jgi:hypothetical protein
MGDRGDIKMASGAGAGGAGNQLANKRAEIPQINVKGPSHLIAVNLGVQDFISYAISLGERLWMHALQRSEDGAIGRLKWPTSERVGTLKGIQQEQRSAGTNGSRAAGVRGACADRQRSEAEDAPRGGSATGRHGDRVSVPRAPQLGKSEQIVLMASLTEWGALPADEAGELVDGRFVEEEVGDAVHEFIVILLGRWFGGWVVPHGGFVLGSDAKFAVRARRGRKPDLSVYLPGGRVPPRRGVIRTAPDFMVESYRPRLATGVGIGSRSPTNTLDSACVGTGSSIPTCEV